MILTVSGSREEGNREEVYYRVVRGKQGERRKAHGLRWLACEMGQVSTEESHFLYFSFALQRNDASKPLPWDEQFAVRG